jgi:hypothetical protein
VSIFFLVMFLCVYISSGIMASKTTYLGCHRQEVNCLSSADNCQDHCTCDKLQSACVDVYPQEPQVQSPQPFEDSDPLDEWIAYSAFDFPYDSIEGGGSTSLSAQQQNVPLSWSHQSLPAHTNKANVAADYSKVGRLESLSKIQQLTGLCVDMFIISKRLNKRSPRGALSGPKRRQ